MAIVQYTPNPILIIKAPILVLASAAAQGVLLRIFLVQTKAERSIGHK